MSREIKFRAWDGQSMSADWEIGDEVVRFNGAIGYREICKEIPFWEVMQFTGVHDKNGREVYEGDILADPERKLLPWEVVNNGYAFGVRHTNNKEIFMVASKYYFEDRQVIGNIYEHPLLLQESEQ
jgi:hypothetical protein